MLLRNENLMKRLHIHIKAKNMENSIHFYSSLFGEEPTKKKADYAKWMLDDPKVNFAISSHIDKKGLDHLGIQVDTISELETVRSQMSNADIKTHNDGEAICCYAKSEKSWIKDPNGISWEAYHTMKDVEIYSDTIQNSQNTCCI